MFGANSNVNVGNLYVSTRPLDGNDFADYVNSDGFLNATTNLTGDIVNLGKMQATQVVLEGNNVTLKNAIDIMNQSDDARNDKVTIKAVNSIEIGNADNVDNIWTHNIGITKFNLISRFDELKNMQSGMNYMLADDIDAKNMLWNGIGHYYGKFNGLNHKISNLLIGGENTTRSHISIFGDLHGVVKNVSIVNSKVYGVEDVGSLVGYMYKDAVIDNCHIVGGEVHGTEFVGGIAGTTKGGSIVDCVNNAYVDGWNCVGGIVGITDSGDFTLKNSINNGHVYCHNDPTLQKYRHDGRYENAHVGGLIGYAGDGVYPCIITNCINYGVVDGTTYVGGIAGSFNGGSIDSCKNFAGINGINNVGGITGACIAGLDYTLVFGNTNNGDVSGTEIVGGIVGMHLAGNIQGNNNFGKIYNNDVEVSGHEVFGGNWSDNEYLENNIMPDNGTETQTEPSEKQPVNGIVTDGKSGTQPNNLIGLNGNLGRLPLNGFKIEGLSEKLPTIGKISDKKLLPTDERLLEEQPMVENNFSYGVKIADSINQSNSRDFQNFSKGSSLVSGTIKATNDDEEKASHHLVLEE